MRRTLLRPFLALVLAMFTWGGGEALAGVQSFATPGVDFAVPAAAVPACHATTLLEARRCAPTGTVITSAVQATQPGVLYIVPSGHGYAIGSFGIGIHVLRSAPVSARAAAASCTGCGWYACGSWLSVEILNTWTSQVGTRLGLHTYNTDYVCNYVYNNSLTPSCNGAGQCTTMSTGVIGNYTYNLNPWYNQRVYYANNNATADYYCRHYLSAQNNVSATAWCSQ